MKTRFSESDAEAQEPTNRSLESNIVIGLFFNFCLQLRQCSFHLIVSNGDISRIRVLLPTPSVWFSLDRIALPFWLRLRLRLRRYWKPALKCLWQIYIFYFLVRFYIRFWYEKGKKFSCFANKLRPQTQSPGFWDNWANQRLESYFRWLPGEISPRNLQSALLVFRIAL